MMPNQRKATFRNVIAAALCFGLLQFATTGSVKADEAISKQQRDFFESRIRPALIEKCYGCHSLKANESQGGLLLDSRAGIRRGGDSGPAVVPGKPESSLLILAIRHSSDELAMPPEDAGEKLPANVIRDFETWVRTGAADPRQESETTVDKYDLSDANSWWSFQPIKFIDPPTQISPRHADWPQTDIDRFVAASWEQAGVSPVDDADPQVLLRRLRFDLTGLPPGEREAEYFTKQWLASPESREALLDKVVDSLLDSHEYAERWGRHWLDVARYAESSGKDVNLVYPHAWRYRDYVIESFHKDKPFDQFLKEQISGDLLPAKEAAERAEHLTATAFLAIGENPINERNPKQFAVDLADDQLGTVTQAFLGITASCARCHDHRFDPVSQRDYTSLAGIFLSTETKFGTAGAVGGRNRTDLIELPVNINLPVVADGISVAEIRSKQARMERLQQQQSDARRQRANGGRATDGLTDFDLVRINTQVSQLEFELSVVNDDGSAKALTMGVGDRPVTAPQTSGPGNRQSRGPGQGGQQMSPRQQGQGGPQRGFGPSMQRGQRPGPGQRGPRQRGAGQRGPSQRGRAGQPNQSGSPGRRIRPGGPEQQQMDGDQPVAGMQQNRRNRSSGFEQIGDSPLFLRGNIENVGDRVLRGIPALLGSGKDIQIQKGSGRLELAESLVSDQNTLTARVIVNRVWYWMFGRGLVASVDNFGTTGAKPSHPELLDYLAARFVRNGWSIKELIRDIARSRVYRLSSSNHPDCFAADPDNAMLWRHNSRRLEAEEIRDAILAASGQLDLHPNDGSMIGRAGDGPIGGLRFQAVTLDQISNANDNFRSIYLPATRSVEPDVLAVFDPADSSTTDGSRDATNVPAQALFMLNSEFVTTQSQALAKLTLRTHPGSNSLSSFSARLRFVFQRVLNREPTGPETDAARNLVRRLGDSRDAWTSVVRGLFGTAECRYVD